MGQVWAQGGAAVILHAGSEVDTLITFIRRARFALQLCFHGYLKPV